MLLFLALGAFTPCVLLPEWRAYQAAQLAVQVERHRLESLQTIVDDERRLLEALQSDPAVILRAAKRELHVEKPGSRSVLISVPPDRPPREELFVPTPVLPPPILARAASYLPDFDYDNIFCDEDTRLVIMAMSVALMLLAVCLPTPKIRAG
jgi:hypothetical protein